MRIRCGRARPGHVGVQRHLLEMAFDATTRRVLTVDKDASAWTTLNERAILGGPMWRIVICPVSKEAT